MRGIRGADAVERPADGDIRDASFLPTQYQIAVVCARIRETRSPREEQRLREWSIAGPVIAPVVAVMETPDEVE